MLVRRNLEAEQPQLRSTRQPELHFSGLSIDKVGTAYTLTATGNTVSTRQQALLLAMGLNIVAGPAAKLAFSTQPGNGTGGIAVSVQPIVTLQDAGGNTSPELHRT